MDDLHGWLLLNRAPRIGPKTFATILSHFQTPQAFFEASAWRNPELKLPALASRFLESAGQEQIQEDLTWLEQDSNHLITYHDARYPPLLKEIPDPPPLLFLRGEPSILTQVQLAIVGSRNPTPLGEENARAFAYHLAKQGMVITSGLAIGIDGVSHQAALDAGGKTIAIMATGLNRVYPSRHHQLAHHIEETGGALVSEFPIGTPPMPKLFPRRNRIISGLSTGTLVVEAAIKSGSLITARQALEQGRDVFAIPGSIHNPLAKGCHKLIRDGAKLVETAQDIFEELGNMALTSHILQSPNPVVNTDADHEYADLLAALVTEPVAIDWLAEKTGYPVNELSSMLLMLELEGKVQAMPGGLYFRASSSP